MKTVTAEFTKAQNAAVTYPVTYVYYKRRYWNAGTNAFVWESSWTQLPLSGIVSIEPIAKQFDSEILNEFKVSNVTLNLKNTDLRWLPWNTSGYFGIDDGSATGYEPYNMKFQVRSGFSNVGGGFTSLLAESTPGGSEELLTIFTGLAMDWQFNSIDGIAVVTVEGLERFLLNGDASRVSTTETLETIGTGDGTTRDFYTKNSGVFKITQVKVNDVAVTIGTDCTVSDLNSVEDGAKIEFAQAPAIGYSVKVTYSHWKKNKAVDSLISDLVSEAGITSTSITNATLGDISNNITHSSRADFDAGTIKTLVNTSLKPGSILVDTDDLSGAAVWQNFSSGTLAGNGWAAVSVSGFPVDFDIVSSELKQNATSSGSSINATYLRKNYGRDIAFGVWQFKIKGDSGITESQVYFMASHDTNIDGYGIHLSTTGFNFYKYVDGRGTQLAYGSYVTLGTTYKTIKITRAMDGTFRLYVDSVLVMTYRDDSITSGNRFMIGLFSGTGSVYFDDIYLPNSTLISEYQSATIDTVSGLDSWGNLTVDYQNSDATVTLKTRVSADASSWDSLVAVSSTNAIQSAVKRYIQVHIDISISTASFPTLETIFYGYTVQFQSDRVFVALGNFSGMTCYDAVSELAKLSDFEWGIDDDETFFFRPRDASSTPDVTFAQNTNLAEIQYLNLGYDKFYSVVRAEFGSFVAEQVAAADQIDSALEIVGRRFFTISSQILVNKDTNVADGIAEIYATRLLQKRRSARIKTKYFPQVELSDTVSLTFNEDAFSGGTALISALICKVVGTRHDPENAFSEFELEEIL